MCCTFGSNIWELFETRCPQGAPAVTWLCFNPASKLSLSSDQRELGKCLNYSCVCGVPAHDMYSTYQEHHLMRSHTYMHKYICACAALMIDLGEEQQNQSPYQQVYRRDLVKRAYWWRMMRNLCKFSKIYPDLPPFPPSPLSLGGDACNLKPLAQMRAMWRFRISPLYRHSFRGWHARLLQIWVCSHKNSPLHLFTKTQAIGVGVPMQS